MTTARAPWLALLLWAWAVAPATAQEASVDEAAAPASEAALPTAKESLQAIPLSDVAGEAEAVAAFLRRVQELVRPTPEQERLVDGFDDLHRVVMRRAARTVAVVSDPPALVAIDDEELYWQRTLDTVTRWRKTLTDEVIELDDGLARLEQLEEIWQLTAEQARAEQAPDAVRQRVTGVLAGIAQGLTVVRERRSQLLELQARISELEGQTSDAVESLAAARVSVRTALFRRDSPAIWRLRVLMESARDAPDAISRSAGSRGSNLFEYADRHLDRVVVLLVVFVTIGFLCTRSRERVQSDDDPSHEGFTVVFERPWSSATLVTVLAGPLLNARAPSSFEQLLGLLLLIPLVRLLPRMVRPAWSPGVYLLAVFLAIDSLRGSLVQDPVLDRMLLLFETTTFTVALVWLIRTAPGRRARSGLPWARLLGSLFSASAATAAAATLANLLGYVNLARLLGEGILSAFFLAAVIYGGVRVLQGAIYAALHNRTAQQLRVLGRHESLMAVWTNRLLGVGGVALWVHFGLKAFHIRRGVYDAFWTALARDFTIGALSVSLDDVAAFALTLTASLIFARIVRAVLEEDVLTRIHTPRGVGHAIAASVQYVLVFLAFVAAISAAGVPLDQLALLASAIGVGIGFGLQDVVRNFVAGLILLFERPIQVGDSIVAGTTEGRVTRIGIRSSTVRTWPGSEVIVPNGQLITQEVSNWTLTDRERRIDLAIYVAPDSDPEAVLAVLNEKATSHPNVLQEPPPSALFVAFAPESMNFELRVWVRFENFLTTRSELGVALHVALKEAGIRTSAPQRDVRVVINDAPAERR